MARRYEGALQAPLLGGGGGGGGGACGQNAIEIQENNVQRNTFWSKISTNCRA